MKRILPIFLVLLMTIAGWCQSVGGCTPAINSQIANGRPTISGTFSEDVQGAQIFVDGTEFTAQAQISGRRISWTPGYNLDNGLHKVKIVGYDILGQTISGQWNFSIIPGSAQNVPNQPGYGLPQAPPNYQPGYGLPQAPPNYRPSGPIASSYWRSSSGASVMINSSDNGLDIELTSTNGSVNRRVGRWLRKYDLFDYSYNGVTYTGQVVSNDQIQVTSPRTNPTTWSRSQQPAAPQPARTDWARYAQGRWSSNSGNIFDIQNQGATLLITCYYKNGQQRQGSGSWIDATSFRFRLSGFNYDTIATFMSDGRVKAISDGGASYWTKNR
jgi:hypothetical protein